MTPQIECIETGQPDDKRFLGFDKCNEKGAVRQFICIIIYKRLILAFGLDVQLFFLNNLCQKAARTLLLKTLFLCR